MGKHGTDAMTGKNLLCYGDNLDVLRRTVRPRGPEKRTERTGTLERGLK